MMPQIVNSTNDLNRSRKIPEMINKIQKHGTKLPSSNVSIKHKCILYLNLDMTLKISHQYLHIFPNPQT